MRFSPLTLILAMFVMGSASNSAVADWPPSKCKHVKVLGAGDTDQISWSHDGGIFSDNSRLENAGPKQLEVLAEALDMMPEILCQGLGKVAFIHRPPKGNKKTVVDAWTKSNDRQNLVYINTWDYLYWNEQNVTRNESFRAHAIQRLIHEASHTAIRLIQSQQKAAPPGTFRQRPDESLWSDQARKAAKAVIARNRLETGILHEWQRMHDAFVSAGMAQAYYGDDWSEKDGYSVEYLAEAGFMSAYGGEQAIEDVAEMTSWAIVRGAAGKPQDGACQVMSSRSDPGVRQQDAAVFTKLGFVRALGFISERSYEQCVGKLKIAAPGQGFHSYRDDNLARSYTENMRGNLGRSEENGPILFTISADGTVDTSGGSVPVTITLSLNVTAHKVDLSNGSNPYSHVTVNDASFARGVYFIGARHGKYNRLTIHRESDGATIMDVGQGVALVNTASMDLMEGSVFVQRVFNYSGGLLSAIAGDEPVSEESRVTFNYQPQSQ